MPMRMAIFVAVLIVSACASEPAVVRPSGVTSFTATVEFLSASRQECDEHFGSDCTKVEVVVTNVGDMQGDTHTQCTVRLLDRQGRQTALVNMLRTSDVAPGDSSSWVVCIGRSPQASYRSRCPAYDAGALSNVG